MPKTKYYIAYGSNLHVAQMQRRCPGAVAVGTGWLDGWRLAFRGSKTGAYLTIIPDKDRRVPVGVWKIDAEHERALDRYEGYPAFYGKKTVRLQMKLLHPTPRAARRTVNAMVYIMDARCLPGNPSREYVRTCAVGYQCFNLPTEYLAAAVDEAWCETREKERWLRKGEKAG